MCTSQWKSGSWQHQGPRWVTSSLNPGHVGNTDLFAQAQCQLVRTPREDFYVVLYFKFQPKYEQWHKTNKQLKKYSNYLINYSFKFKLFGKQLYDMYLFLMW